MTLVQIRLRHDASADWVPTVVLAEGEVGVETDTGLMKVGDGIRQWSVLPYSAPLLSSVNTSAVGSQSPGVSTTAARSDHSHALPQVATFATVNTTGNAFFGKNVTITGNLVGGTHSHAIADVTGLQAALDEKADEGAPILLSAISGFPSQTGNGGKVLATDGSSLSWATSVGGGSSIAQGAGISVTQDSDGVYTVALDATSVTSVTADGVALSGGIEISAGSNVNVTRSGQSVVISATTGSGGVAGVASLEGVTGAVLLAEGNGITISSSGQTITIASDALPATSSPLALGSAASAGTSLDYARADHVHALPAANSLPITAGVDWSAYTLKYQNAYATVGQSPTASTVPGMYAYIDSLPRYSDGSSWVPLAEEDHSHAIADVTGLQDELDGKEDAGVSVKSVNGVMPDQTGAVTIDTNVGSVAWTSVTGRPTAVSEFLNDLEFITSDDVFAALESGTGITVSQDPETNAAVISLSGAVGGDYSAPAEPATPDPNDSQDQPLTVAAWPGPSVDAINRNQIKLSVTAVGGTGTYSFQWQVAQWDDLNPDPTFVNISNNTTYQGAQTAELTVNGVDSDMHGDKYRCVITSGSFTVTTDESAVSAMRMSITSHPESATVRDGDLIYVGDVARVSYQGAKNGRVRYTWQVSSIPATGQYSFGRGTLFLNISSGTHEGTDGTVTLDYIDRNAVNFAELTTSVSGAPERKLFLRCILWDDYDLFTLTPNPGGGRFPSEQGIITVLPGAPGIITQPTSQTISSTGSATFTVEYSYAAPVQWLKRAEDGYSSDPADGTVTYASTANGASSTLFLQGLDASNIFDRYVARIGNVETGYAYSDWVMLLGQPAQIIDQPEHATTVSGSSVTFEASFRLPSGAALQSASWEYRINRGTSEDTDWVSAGSGTLTGTGTQVASLSLSAVGTVNDGEEYRLKVIAQGATAAYSDPARISIIQDAQPGDFTLTFDLEDDTVEHGGSYYRQVTSTLLGAVDHYACLLVDNGTSQHIRALKTGNGIPVANKPELRQFPAGAFQTYEVELDQITTTTTVKLLVSTSPFEYSQVDNGGSFTVTASPFADQAIVQRDSNGIRWGYTYTYGNRSFQYSGTPVGFSATRQATIVARPTRYMQPSPAVHGTVWFPPESFRFRGAANAAGTVVAAGTMNSSLVMASVDQGLTWSTYMLPWSTRCYSLVWHRGNFLLFCRSADGSSYTALKSSDGEEWSSTGWNFGAALPDGYYRQDVMPYYSYGNPDGYLWGDWYPPSRAVKQGTSTDHAAIPQDMLGPDARVVDGMLHVAVPYIPTTIGGIKARSFYLRSSDPLTRTNWLQHNTPILPRYLFKVHNQWGCGDRVSSDGVNWTRNSDGRFYTSAIEVSLDNESQEYTLAVETPLQTNLAPGVRLVAPGQLGVSSSYMYEASAEWLSSLPSVPLSFGFGPQVGGASTGDDQAEVYGAWDGTANTGTAIRRCPVLYPNNVSNLVVAPTYDTNFQLERDYSYTSVSDVYHAAYRYGPEKQMPGKWLDGTNTPGDGSVIYTQDYVLFLFRWNVQRQTSTTSSTYNLPQPPVLDMT